MHDGNGRYDDEQSARIIWRALELQKSECGEESGDPGMSLTELEAIGRGTGIEPHLIRRAADEISDETPPPFQGLAHTLFGTPTRGVAVSHASVRVNRESMEALLVLLPSITGDGGYGSIAMQSLVWNSDTITAMRTGRNLSVIVQPVPRGMEVRLESNFGALAGGLFGGVVGGLGLGGGLGVGFGVGLSVLGSVLFTALVPIGMIVGSWFLSRWVLSAIARYRARRDNQIVGTIRRTLERHGIPAPTDGD